VLKPLNEDNIFDVYLLPYPQVLSSMPGLDVIGLEQRDQHDRSRSIDIVACYKGQLLAVEVDGPQHFTWPGLRPTGDTLSRNRALQRRGYRVVPVPVNPGWRQQRGQQQQQSFLQGLLDGQPTTATSDATTTPTTRRRGRSSSSSSSSRKPLARVPSTGLAAPGAHGLLARPQQPQPAAAAGQPANRERKTAKKQS
jgi:hypothetical protein